MSSPGHGGHFDSVAPLDRPDGISRTSSRSAACHQACTPRECKGKTAETRALMQLGGAAAHGCAKNGDDKVGARVDRVGGRLATRGMNTRGAAAAPSRMKFDPFPA